LIHEDTTHNSSFLKVTAGHRCSWHSHKSKANLFVVIHGDVGIVTEHGETRLTEGHCFTVMPDLKHEFRAYMDSEMIEIMFVKYDENDIDREKLGSKFMDGKARRPDISHVTMGGNGGNV
jgi:mannose-6-phosphate isomerase-like protein (cupin superfamily)